MIASTKKRAQMLWVLIDCEHKEKSTDVVVVD